MRSPTNLGRGSVGFNMTPMIDVVFLLIIFFLVSSHLARQEAQVALELPDASSGERPEEEDVRRIIVNVLSENQILVGSQPIEPARLETLLDYESQHALGAGKTRALEVRIRTDRTVPYRAVEPILLACARSGIWNVKFAVISK